jgi:hypothetical protein
VDATVEVTHEVTGDLDSSLSRLTSIPAMRNAWSTEAIKLHRE